MKKVLNFVKDLFFLPFTVTKKIHSVALKEVYRPVVGTLVGGTALVVSTSASATTVYDGLVAAVSFTDLISALTTVYASIVVVGMFMLGADIILRKLGWKR